MFLSKLVLNARNANARRDLGSPYEMHRTILSAGFDGVPKEDFGRVLFRVDNDPTGRTPPFVLVQAHQEPRWEGLPTGYVVAGPQSKLFDPQFQIGQRLRFRLRANPTKRVAVKNTVLGETLGGKRVGLFAESDHIAWLLKREATGGFRIPGKWEEQDGLKVANFRMDAIPEGRVWNGKAGAGGWFLSVRFEGLLEVTDPDAFRALIETGIGSAKGFGFGLLSVAPV